MDAKTVIEDAIRRWVDKYTGGPLDGKMTPETRELADTIHSDLCSMCGEMARDLNHQKWASEWRCYVRARMFGLDAQAEMAYDRLDALARSKP